MAQSPFDELSRGNVCGGPVEPAKVARLAPRQVRVLDKMWCSRYEDAIERGEVYNAEFVLVTGRGDFIADDDVATKFLMDLSHQGCLRCLARLDLASRELPHAGQGAIRSALDAQHFALRDDDCAHDADVLLHEVPSVGGEA